MNVPPTRSPPLSVSRSYSGSLWEGVPPIPLQPECAANGDCILRTSTQGVYRVDVVARGS